MTQHDYRLENDLGATFRDDLNQALAAIASTNMGPDAPTTTRPGMLWVAVVSGSDGVLRVRDAQDGSWLVIGMGSQHLPLTGGTISGNLSVAGIFSNPQFNAAKGSFSSTTAPSPASPGQLWYDLNYTPGLLKIRNPGNTAWVEVVDKTSPTFTDSMTISNQGTGNAQLNLYSQGERRRVVGEASGNRWAFYAGANDTLTAYISDAGDLYLGALSFQALSTVLASKQPALGFTPVRQADGNLIHIGSNPAHLWLNNVDQGEISVGSGVPQFARGDIGVFTWMVPDANVAYNWTGPGSSLRFYPAAEGARATGTWAVMDYSIGAGSSGLFHRIA